jgi:integration host factor subunit beta
LALAKRSGGASMTKSEIVSELLGRRPTLSHRQAEFVVNAVFDAMAAALADGSRVEIRSFGTFGVKQRRARQLRNPRTGESLEVKPKRVPFFRAGGELREEVNERTGYNVAKS